MPRLSILIPCLGGSAEFDGTLVSVLQNRPPKSEIIVVHTAAYDDPYDLAEEVQFVRRPTESSLVQLINAGLDAASSPFVHVLACGLEASEGWSDAALAHFADDEVAAVVPAVMSADGSRLVAAGVRFSAGGIRCVLRNQKLLMGGSGHLRANIAGPTLSAGFFRRDLLVAMGGLNRHAGDQLADVDLALTLADLELRAVFEPASQVVQVAESTEMASGSAFTRGRAAERLFWRNAARRGLPVALAMHPLAVLADLPSVLGRLVALVEVGSTARHQMLMAKIGAQLAEMRSQEQTTLPLPARTSAPPRRKAA